MSILPNKMTSAFAASGLLSLLLVLILPVAAAPEDAFPREELSTVDGLNWNFDRAREARLTVLDFWALWCAPCMQTLPELRDLAESMKDLPVQFVFVNCDNTRSRSRVRSFVRARGIESTVVLDPSQKLMRRYGISSLPHLLVLDSRGRIVERKSGYMPGDDKALEKRLVELLDND